MSNIKISQLPSAGALSGSEIIPIVQAGDTKSTSINSIVGQVGLQQVLDNNNTANQNILLDDGSGNISAIAPAGMITSNSGDQIWLQPQYIRIDKGTPSSSNYLKTTNVTSNRNWELPDANGILAVSTTVGYSGSKTIGGQVYTWENGILITVV
jgi:hypothetical protein